MDRSYRDALVKIALELDLPSIINYCQTNKNINRAVCQNDLFWINKLSKDYGFNFSKKSGQLRLARAYYQILSGPEVTGLVTGLETAVRSGYLDLVAHYLEKTNFDLARLIIEAANLNNDQILDLLLRKTIKMDQYLAWEDLLYLAGKAPSKSQKILSYGKYLAKDVLTGLLEKLESGNPLYIDSYLKILRDDEYYYLEDLAKISSVPIPELHDYIIKNYSHYLNLIL